MAFQVITTDYQTHQHDIQFVRQQVFIIEQHIDPTLEWDADDHSALFALAQDQHKKPMIIFTRVADSRAIQKNYTMN